MAGPEQFQSRAKAWAAEIGAARRRAGLLLPDGVLDVLQPWRATLGRWIVAEIAPGRLMPWLPVAFGAGIVLYFTADREPAWWSAVPLVLAGITIAILVRRRAFGFPLALGFAAIAAGFATATLKSVYVTHPILYYPASSVALSGFVETT